jgi:alanine racemase
LDLANALSAAATKFRTTAKVHLKIETGTNRQGVALVNWRDSSTLNRLPAIEIEGVYTHFANIEDTLDPEFARAQVDKF